MMKFWHTHYQDMNTTVNRRYLLIYSIHIQTLTSSTVSSPKIWFETNNSVRNICPLKNIFLKNLHVSPLHYIKKLILWLHLWTMSLYRLMLESSKSFFKISDIQLNTILNENYTTSLTIQLSSVPMNDKQVNLSYAHPVEHHIQYDRLYLLLIANSIPSIFLQKRITIDHKKLWIFLF